MLNTITHGTPTDRPGLLIAHGLYGSARNWGVIAKRLSETRQVIAVDMRNHGASKRTDTHSYHDLADDLATVLDGMSQPFDVLGHSMGGKAAMALALTHADLVNRLIVADIAPVSYEHSQLKYAQAMLGTDLSGIERRSDAAARLLPRIDDPALVPFFLQSLDIKNQRWTLHLETLIDQMPQIMGFPDFAAAFAKPSLFLTGANSEYVTRDHRTPIKGLFPQAQFLKIPGAGHWLHAEKPREFGAAVEAWLNR